MSFLEEFLWGDINQGILQWEGSDWYWGVEDQGFALFQGSQLGMRRYRLVSKRRWEDCYLLIYSLQWRGLKYIYTHIGKERDEDIGEKCIYMTNITQYLFLKVCVYKCLNIYKYAIICVYFYVYPYMHMYIEMHRSIFTL